MKRTILSIFIGMLLSPVFAQEEGKSFKGYLYNDEYEVFLRINFYDKNIKIAGQELLRRRLP